MNVTLLIFVISLVVILAVFRSMSRPPKKVRRRRLKPRWTDDGRPDFRR